MTCPNNLPDGMEIVHQGVSIYCVTFVTPFDSPGSPLDDSIPQKSFRPLYSLNSTVALQRDPPIYGPS